MTGPCLVSSRMVEGIRGLTAGVTVINQCKADGVVIPIDYEIRFRLDLQVL